MINNPQNPADPEDPALWEEGFRQRQEYAKDEEGLNLLAMGREPLSHEDHKETFAWFNEYLGSRDLDFDDWVDEAGEEGWGWQAAKVVPFLGDWVKGKDGEKFIGLVRKSEAMIADPEAEALTEDEADWMLDYMDKMGRDQTLGYMLPGMALDTTRFAFEFALFRGMGKAKNAYLSKYIEVGEDGLALAKQGLRGKLALRGQRLADQLNDYKATKQGKPIPGVKPEPVVPGVSSLRIATKGDVWAARGKRLGRWAKDGAVMGAVMEGAKETPMLFGAEGISRTRQTMIDYMIGGVAAAEDDYGRRFALADEMLSTPEASWIGRQILSTMAEYASETAGGALMAPVKGGARSLAGAARKSTLAATQIGDKTAYEWWNGVATAISHRYRKAKGEGKFTAALGDRFALDGMIGEMLEEELNRDLTGAIFSFSEDQRAFIVETPEGTFKVNYDKLLPEGKEVAAQAILFGGLGGVKFLGDVGITGRGRRLAEANAVSNMVNDFRTFAEQTAEEGNEANQKLLDRLKELDSELYGKLVEGKGEATGEDLETLEELLAENDDLQPLLDNSTVAHSLRSARQDAGVSDAVQSQAQKLAEDNGSDPKKVRVVRAASGWQSWLSEQASKMGIDLFWVTGDSTLDSSPGRRSKFQDRDESGEEYERTAIFLDARLTAEVGGRLTPGALYGLFNHELQHEFDLNEDNSELVKSFDAAIDAIYPNGVPEAFDRYVFQQAVSYYANEAAGGAEVTEQHFAAAHALLTNDPSLLEDYRDNIYRGERSHLSEDAAWEEHKMLEGRAQLAQDLSPLTMFMATPSGAQFVDWLQNNKPGTLEKFIDWVKSRAEKMLGMEGSDKLKPTRFKMLASVVNAVNDIAGFDAASGVYQNIDSLGLTEQVQLADLFTRILQTESGTQDIRPEDLEDLAAQEKPVREEFQAKREEARKEFEQKQEEALKEATEAATQQRKDQLNEESLTTLKDLAKYYRDNFGFDYKGVSKYRLADRPELVDRLVAFELEMLESPPELEPTAEEEAPELPGADVRADMLDELIAQLEAEAEAAETEEEAEGLQQRAAGMRAEQERLRSEAEREHHEGEPLGQPISYVNEGMVKQTIEDMRDMDMLPEPGDVDMAETIASGFDLLDAKQLKALADWLVNQPEAFLNSDLAQAVVRQSFLRDDALDAAPLTYSQIEAVRMGADVASLAPGVGEPLLKRRASEHTSELNEDGSLTVTLRDDDPEAPARTFTRRSTPILDAAPLTFRRAPGAPLVSRHRADDRGALFDFEVKDNDGNDWLTVLIEITDNGVATGYNDYIPKFLVVFKTMEFDPVSGYPGQPTTKFVDTSKRPDAALLIMRTVQDVINHDFMNRLINPYYQAQEVFDNGGDPYVGSLLPFAQYEYSAASITETKHSAHGMEGRSSLYERMTKRWARKTEDAYAEVEIVPPSPEVVYGGSTTFKVTVASTPKDFLTATGRRHPSDSAPEQINDAAPFYHKIDTALDELSKVGKGKKVYTPLEVYQELTKRHNITEEEFQLSGFYDLFTEPLEDDAWDSREQSIKKQEKVVEDARKVLEDLKKQAEAAPSQKEKDQIQQGQPWREAKSALKAANAELQTLINPASARVWRDKFEVDVSYAPDIAQEQNLAPDMDVEVSGLTAAQYASIVKDHGVTYSVKAFDIGIKYASMAPGNSSNIYVAQIAVTRPAHWSGATVNEFGEQRRRADVDHPEAIPHNFEGMHRHGQTPATLEMSPGGRQQEFAFMWYSFYTDANGQKQLFVHEFQTDWGGGYMKGGYGDSQGGLLRETLLEGSLKKLLEEYAKDPGARAVHGDYRLAQKAQVLFQANERSRGTEIRIRVDGLINERGNTPARALVARYGARMERTADGGHEVVIDSWTPVDKDYAVNQLFEEQIAGQFAEAVYEEVLKPYLEERNSADIGSLEDGVEAGRYDAIMAYREYVEAYNAMQQDPDDGTLQSEYLDAKDEYELKLRNFKEDKEEYEKTLADHDNDLDISLSEFGLKQKTPKLDAVAPLFKMLRISSRDAGVRASGLSYFTAMALVERLPNHMKNKWAMFAKARYDQKYNPQDAKGSLVAAMVGLSDELYASDSFLSETIELTADGEAADNHSFVAHPYTGDVLDFIEMYYTGVKLTTDPDYWRDTNAPTALTQPGHHYGVDYSPHDADIAALLPDLNVHTEAKILVDQSTAGPNILSLGIARAMMETGEGTFNDRQFILVPQGQGRDTDPAGATFDGSLAGFIKAVLGKDSLVVDAMASPDNMGRGSHSLADPDLHMGDIYQAARVGVVGQKIDGLSMFVGRRMAEKPEGIGPPALPEPMYFDFSHGSEDKFMYPFSHNPGQGAHGEARALMMALGSRGMEEFTGNRYHATDVDRAHSTTVARPLRGNLMEGEIDRFVKSRVISARTSPGYLLPADNLISGGKLPAVVQEYMEDVRANASSRPIDRRPPMYKNWHEKMAWVALRHAAEAGANTVLWTAATHLSTHGDRQSRVDIYDHTMPTAFRKVMKIMHKMAVAEAKARASKGDEEAKAWLEQHKDDKPNMPAKLPWTSVHGATRDIKADAKKALSQRLGRNKIGGKSAAASRIHELHSQLRALSVAVADDLFGFNTRQSLDQTKDGIHPMRLALYSMRDRLEQELTDGTITEGGRATLAGVRAALVHFKQSRPGDTRHWARMEGLIDVLSIHAVDEMHGRKKGFTLPDGSTKRWEAKTNYSKRFFASFAMGLSSMNVVEADYNVAEWADAVDSFVLALITETHAQLATRAQEQGADQGEADAWLADTAELHGRTSGDILWRTAKKNDWAFGVDGLGTTGLGAGAVAGPGFDPSREAQQGVPLQLAAGPSLPGEYAPTQPYVAWQLPLGPSLLRHAEDVSMHWYAAPLVPRQFMHFDRTGFDIPAFTSTMATIQAVQNNMVQLLGTEEAARRHWREKADKRMRDVYGWELPEAARPYSSEQVRKRLTVNRLEAFHRDYVEPLIKFIGDSGLTIGKPGEFGDLGHFLISRHAPSRNKLIHEQRDPKNEAGSGMSTDVALANLERYRGLDNYADYEKAADMVYAMLDHTLGGWVSDGLHTQDVVDGLKDQWEYYVPVRSVDVEEGLGAGAGADLRSNEFKVALGRFSMADDPVTFAVSQGALSIIRGEKARVGRSLLNLIRQMQALEETGKVAFAAINIPEVRRGRVRGGFVSDNLRDSNFWNRDNVVVVRENGMPVAITFDAKHTSLAMALKGMNAYHGGSVMTALHAFSRFRGAASTRYNPVFPIYNAIRDFKGAYFAAGSEHGQKFAARIMGPGSLRKAYGSLIRYNNLTFGLAEFDAEGNDADAMLQRWYDAGGPIAFYYQEPIVDQYKRLMKDVKHATDGRGFGTIAASAVGEFVGSVNDVVENAIRLSFFSHAIKPESEGGLGMTDQEAAIASKDLTTNFETGGDYRTMLNTWQMFGNANMQGIEKGWRVVMMKKAWKLMTQAFFLHFGLAVYNILAGGDDEDGEPHHSKIDNHRKRRDLIIMNPDGSGRAFHSPMPFVYGFIGSLGTFSAEWVMGERTFGDTLANVGESFIDHLNPLGGLMSLKDLFPDPIQPMIDVSVNRDWKDAPIMPERFGDMTAPDAHLYFDSVNPTVKELMAELNKLPGPWGPGGNAHRSGGFADVSPESVEYLFSSYAGGAGAFAGRIVTLMDKTWKGEEKIWEDYPLARRMYSEPRPYIAKVRYRQNSDYVNRAVSEVRDGIESRDMWTLEPSPELGGLSVYAVRKAIEGGVVKLRTAKAALEPDDPRMKGLNEAEIKLKNAFNTAFNKAAKASGAWPLSRR